MLDIRLSISTSAGSVSQRLRNHLTNQQNVPLFGSPRPVLSWTATPIGGRPEPSWEQIRASTMELQQQLQQWRGETRGPGVVEEPVAPASRPPQNSRSGPAETLAPVPNQAPHATNGQSGRSSRPQQVPASPASPMNPAASVVDTPFAAAQQPTTPTPPIRPSQPPAQPGQYGRSAAASAPNPSFTSSNNVSPFIPNVPKTTVQNPSGPVPTPPVVPRRPSGKLMQPVEQNISARHSGGEMRTRSTTSPTPAVEPSSVLGCPAGESASHPR